MSLFGHFDQLYTAAEMTNDVVSKLFRLQFVTREFFSSV